jgi:F-type H+-transporting ATPase subunit a
MNTILAQLSQSLAHLGEKQIVTLPLGPLSLQFDKTALIMSWIVMAILVGIALFLRRALKQDTEDKPNRIQAALDAVIGLLQGQLTANFSSEQMARRLFPFISTLFLFVLLSNWLGAIPGLSSPTQDLNVTLGLALMVFVLSQVMAIQAKGMRGYVKGYLEPVPFLLPLNIIGQVSRPLSHAFRLFGNILAGTILIAVVMAKFAPIIIPPVLNVIFGLFFGTIQAFVFAILAVAYIDVAVEG